MFVSFIKSAFSPWRFSQVACAAAALHMLLLALSVLRVP